MARLSSDLHHVPQQFRGQEPPAARAKSALRERIRQARGLRTPEEITAAAHALEGLLVPEILALVPSGGTVAAFLPTATEPPVLSTLAALCAAGRTVLVPRALPGRTMAWTGWTPDAPVRHSPVGILEPTGPDRGAEAFQEAAVRLVPALALGRDGTRLGQGGGYYDRALADLAPEDPRTWGVVFAEELLDAVPAEPHDARLVAARTPEGPVRLR